MLKFLKKNVVKNEEGFTLVELMIVVVIIGILAAIAIPVFANQEKNAFEAEAKSDLKTIQSSIILAQSKTNKTLFQITGQSLSANECLGAIDPKSVNPTSDNCWNQYNGSLISISAASGIDIKGYVDPYGRPYYINPNELERTNLGFPDCRHDLLGTFDEPYTRTATYQRSLPMVSGECIKLN